MVSKSSVFADSWRQTTPGTILFKHPLSRASVIAETLNEPVSKAYALRAIARVYRQLGDRAVAQAVLDQALAATKTIDAPSSKATALRVIARAYEQLGDGAAAQVVLDQVLAAAETIDDPNSKASALRVIARAYGQLGDGVVAQAVLEQALAATEIIDAPSSKATALRVIARAYGQLGDGAAAQAVLDQALVATETIDAPSSKAAALSAITTACGQLGDIQTIHVLLLNVRQVAEKSSVSYILREIAPYQALYGNWGAALRTLKNAFGADKISVLAQMLNHHAESKTPQLIDSPKVLAVTPALADAGQYQFAATLQSPDEDCDRHADWWEVLTEEGDLVARQLLDSPHEFEKPFTTETTLTVNPAQTLIVRAHFSDSIIQDSYDNYGNPTSEPKYPNQAMKGSIDQGFNSVRIPPRFAARVERQDPQPGVCKDK